MGVLQYMQAGGPSFISYRRDPDRSGLVVREPKEKPAYKGTEFDLDLLANPGDKQWLYDQHKKLEGTMSQLYSEYGGEGPFMREDQRYKDAIAESRYAIYDSQTGKQNYDRGVERHKQLSTPDSGQNPYDFELTRQGNVMLPQAGERGFLNKAEYHQQIVTTPQEFERPDGSIGLLHVEYDQGRGSEKMSNDVFDNILMGDSRIGINSGGSIDIQSNDTGYTKGLKYSVGWLEENSSKWSDNYEGLRQAIDYVTKYGFDDQVEYHMWQSMWDHVEEGRPMYRPAMDESGEIRKDDKGKVILEEYNLPPELISRAKSGDAEALVEIEGVYGDYVTQRFIEYSDKFRKENIERTYRRQDTREGYDPDTGLRVEEDKPKWWHDVATNDNFTGQTKGQQNKQYVWDGSSWVLQEKGKTAQGDEVDVTNLRYEDPSTANLFFDQARTALLGNNIGDISSNLDWDPSDLNKKMMVGNTWQDMPAGLKDAQIADVLGYEEIIAPNGDVIHGTRVVIYGDDDNDAFRDVKFYNERTGKAENVLELDYGWGNDLNQYEPHAEAEQMGFIKWQHRDEVDESQKNFIHQDEGTHWLDADDHYVYKMEVVIPTSKVATAGHDAYEFGTTQRVRQGEVITEDTRRTNQYMIEQQERLKEKTKVPKPVFPGPTDK
jgi:hypothetical protein